MGESYNKICTNCRKLLMSGKDKLDDIYISKDNNYYCTVCWYYKGAYDKDGTNSAEMERLLQRLESEYGLVPSALAQMIE